MPNTGTRPTSRADLLDRARQRGGVAGAVGEEHAVGPAGEHRRRAGVGAGHDLDLGDLAELVEDASA